MPSARWQKRLQYTGVDNSSQRNIIGLENELVDGHGQCANDFIDEIVQINDSKGRVSTEDIIRVLVQQLDEFTSNYKDRMKFYLERLHNTSREKARDRAGLTKRSARVKIAQSEDERNAELLRSIDMAFRSVTSLPENIVERLRDRLRQGLVTGISTEQVLRSILQDEINDLNLEQDGDLREAVRRVWDRTRNDLLRVIRTETVNAYSRVQLQEWQDAGIRQVTRHSISDERTCAVCRALAQPPDNVYSVGSLLALDYPVTQDPATGEWLTHPSCRCTPNEMTEVYTVNGWIPIKDVVVGELVLTHEGRFKKVVALKNQSYLPAGQGVIDIVFEHYWRKGRLGKRDVVLSVTPDHPFMTKKSWVLAKDLNIDSEFMVLAKSCKRCGKMYPWFVFTEHTNFCSQSCASKTIATEDWKRPERHEIQRLYVAEQVKKENRKENWSLEKRQALTAAGRKVLQDRIEKGEFHLQKQNRRFASWMDMPGPKKDAVCAKISRIKIETGDNARACAANQGTISKGQRELYERVKQFVATAVLNYPIQPVRGKRSYVLDVAIPEHKICVEYDGSYWHSGEKHKEKDRKRDQILSEHGWITFRVAEGESFEPVIEKVERLLANHEGQYKFMWMTPSNIGSHSYEKKRRLWNLEVEDDHSYIMRGIVSHNCWFEPIVEDVWAEVEGIEKDLFGDLQSRDTKAVAVPIDSQDHVEKMLKEMSEPLTMQFTGKIEELPEWQEWRLQTLLDEGTSPERANVMVSDESFIGALTEWADPKTGIHYIADDARSIDYVTFPMARAEASKKWEGFDLGLTGWVQNQFDEKKREMGMTLENEGIEIFGGQPFLNIPASNSPRDYFIESYAYYFVNPTVLQALDEKMYDFLNEKVFNGREFLERGGIK